MILFFDHLLSQRLSIRPAAIPLEKQPKITPIDKSISFFCRITPFKTNHFQNFIFISYFCFRQIASAPCKEYFLLTILINH